jgi:hypothetical protein
MQTPTPIARISPPPAEVFRRDYLEAARPVIITGLIDDWPARRQWSFDYFEQRFGDRRLTSVPLENGKAAYGRGPRGVPYQTVRFRDYLSMIRTAGSADRAVVFSVEEELPELLDDVARPPYCTEAGWFRSRFWFSPPDARGALHRDLPENLYAQVIGHKEWLIYDRRETARMYSNPPWSALPHFSRVDAVDPDLTRFPRFAGTHPFHCVLEPGDVLFLPSRWWHQARSLDCSVSINFWWADGALQWVIRAAEVFAKVRALRP